MLRIYVPAIICGLLSSLLPLAGSRANDLCQDVGSTRTCEGDQSDGVVNGGYPNLIVQNLSTPIQPLLGDGVGATSSSPLFVIVDTGVLGITALSGIGIRAELGGNGDLTLSSTGEITARSGIYATRIYHELFNTINSGGNLSVTQNGAIETTTYGVTATNASYITSSISSVEAATGNLDVTVTSIHSVGPSNIGINASNEAQAFNLAGGGTATANNGSTTIISSGLIQLDGQNSIGLLFTAGAYAEAPDSAGAYGADVHIKTQDIVTHGIGSAGMFISPFAVASASNANWAAALGQSIHVESLGKITTLGDSSYGIYVDTATRAFSMSGAVTTVGGDITIDVKDIEMKGGSSDALVIRSYVDGNTTGAVVAQSGNVTVNVTGSIVADKVGSQGISAYSYVQGIPGVNGDIHVNVLGGSVVAYNRAIYVNTGRNNTIYNIGSISSLIGSTIEGGNGNEVITNDGLIVGGVDLGGGTNSFENRSAGIFESGAVVDLGIANTLTNQGTLSPRGATVGISTVVGNFVQAIDGKLLVSADWTANLSDQLIVQSTAHLAGTVVAIPQNFPATAGLSKEFLIVRAAGGAINDGLIAQDTATVDYGVRFDGNGTDVFLTAFVNFLGVGVGGLNPNQTAIAENLNVIISSSGSPKISSLSNALLTLPTQDALANALDQLSPEIYNYQKIDTLFAAEQFSADLLSCRVGEGDGYSFIREGQCIWARARARFLDLDATANNIGAESTIGSFSGGGQAAIAPDWRLGLAVGYDTSSISTPTGASADGDRANIGAVLKYNPSSLLVAGSVTSGWSNFDTSRNISFGGFSNSASGDSDVDYVSGRLHLAYLFGRPDWHLKPMVDATATRLSFSDLYETGGGGAALHVNGDHDTVFSVSPALELGGLLRIDETAVLRPFARAGVTWRDGDDMSLDAEFAAAPVGFFKTKTALDEVLADLSAGVEVITRDGSAIRLQYDGRFGSDTQQNSASVKGSVPF